MSSMGVERSHGLVHLLSLVKAKTATEPHTNEGCTLHAHACAFSWVNTVLWCSGLLRPSPCPSLGRLTANPIDFHRKMTQSLVTPGQASNPSKMMKQKTLSCLLCEGEGFQTNDAVCFVCGFTHSCSYNSVHECERCVCETTRRVDATLGQEGGGRPQLGGQVWKVSCLFVTIVQTWRGGKHFLSGGH